MQKEKKKNQVNYLQLWSSLNVLINVNLCSNQSTLSKFLRLLPYALKALKRCGCTALCSGLFLGDFLGFFKHNFDRSKCSLNMQSNLSGC